jgi:hypothetical protein
MKEMQLSHGAYWQRAKRLKEIDRQKLHEKFSGHPATEIRIFEEGYCVSLQTWKALPISKQ